MNFALNVLASALIIAAAAALSVRYPVAAGFLVALPLSTMLVLPLSHIQHGDATATITFAKSILVAIPITFLFFVPLLLAERLGLSFWSAYVAGCALLPVGFLVHSALGRFIERSAIRRRLRDRPTRRFSGPAWPAAERQRGPPRFAVKIQR